MANFKDFNFAVGVLLSKAVSEEDLKDLKLLPDSVRKHIVLENIKEGFFSKCSEDLRGDSEKNKEYYYKLKNLNLITVKTRDVLNDEIFVYLGKKVRIKSKSPLFFGKDAFTIEGEVKFIKHDEQMQEFLLGVKGAKSKGKSWLNQLIECINESLIESIEIVE